MVTREQHRIYEARYRAKKRSDPSWVESQRAAGRRWRARNPAMIRASSQRAQMRIRVTVLEVVGHGRIACENCGVSDIRILELNHKNGGGRKDNAAHNFGGGYDPYRAVYFGRRRFDDLNILCRVCNALDHLERRVPDIAGTCTVTWSGVN